MNFDTFSREEAEEVLELDLNNLEDSIDIAIIIDIQSHDSEQVDSILGDLEEAEDKADYYQEELAKSEEKIKGLNIAVSALISHIEKN